jgi:hypothetical protein
MNGNDRLISDHRSITYKQTNRRSH